MVQQEQGLIVKLCLQYLDDGHLADVARLSLLYYDKAYNYNYDKNKEQQIIPVESDTTDAAINARKVEQVLKTIN